MSVEQTDVVDFISIDKHGTAVLTISDHLGWDSADDHVVKLQKELNRYLVFIESGDLLKSYPNAKGRKVAIRIVGKYAPEREGEVFLSQARETIEAAGYALTFERLDDG